VSSTSFSFSTAGSMKSVWKAPATAKRIVMRALKSGLAMAMTASHAAASPETA
jgi:hypothetical protein